MVYALQPDYKIVPLEITKQEMAEFLPILIDKKKPDFTMNDIFRNKILPQLKVVE